MQKTAKYRPTQMNLAGECGLFGSSTVHGADVFCTGESRVSHQWLSACRKERALTEGLMDKIADPLNLQRALKKVVKNGGSSGIDGMSVGGLKKWFSANLSILVSELKAGIYLPSPVREVRIPKPTGGYRLLGIPTAKDRLVQQAISQVLSIRYEPVFSDSSYGFRPRRKAHDAVREAGKYVAGSRDWIIDIDLEKFFDKVSHDRLLWLLSTRVGDKTLLKLINRFLRSGILREGLLEQRIKGTAQGSPLSPLLSNIVLDELDKELEFRGHRFVRYADDLIIMVKSEKSAERTLQSITLFIEERLRLKVNRDKSRIRRPYELNFLGFSLLKDGSMGLSKQSEERFKRKLKSLTNRNRGISLQQLVDKLNPILRGWLNYFKPARMGKRLRRLEGWLNRRIRCFRLKQCKRAIGIARFLHKLGVPWRRCWTVAGSSKGWYRLSGSYSSHEAMSIKWFRSIGLFSLSEFYG